MLLITSVDAEQLMGKRISHYSALIVPPQVEKCFIT